MNTDGANQENHIQAAEKQGRKTPASKTNKTEARKLAPKQRCAEDFFRRFTSHCPLVAYSSNQVLQRADSGSTVHQLTQSLLNDSPPLGHFPDLMRGTADNIPTNELFRKLRQILLSPLPLIIAVHLNA